MLTALAIVAALAAQAQAFTPNIALTGGLKWTYKGLLESSGSATFDASGMLLTASSPVAYIAHDPYSEQQDDDKYVYTYNVGGAVPSAAIGNGYCVSTSGQYSAAYRTKSASVNDDVYSDDKPTTNDDDPTKYCKAMTPGYNGKSGPALLAQAGLHDVDRPAHGWNVTYGYSSTKCAAITTPGKQLPVQYVQFRHIFICEDAPTPTAQQTNQGNNWTIVLMERDVTGCYVSVYVHGHVGCPTECPITNGKLCGGNGICDYDQGLQKARCFCNSDYIEADCSTEADPSPTGAIVGAVFGGLFMGAAIVGVYWFFRVRGADGAGGSPGDGYYEAAE